MKAKKYLLAFFAWVCVVAISLSFASCSSDDDEKEQETNTLSKIKTEYTVSLDENWYKFFDIEMTYTTVTGSTETITLTEDYSIDSEIPVEMEPAMYICKITAKPKANAPAIEDGKTYPMGCSVHAIVTGYLKDGKQDTDYGFRGENVSNMEYSSKYMTTYIQQEHSILNFHYTPKED